MLNRRESKIETKQIIVERYMNYIYFSRNISHDVERDELKKSPQNSAAKH